LTLLVLALQLDESLLLVVAKAELGIQVVSKLHWQVEEPAVPEAEPLDFLLMQQLLVEVPKLLDKEILVEVLMELMLLHITQVAVVVQVLLV
jgi:hypothetical protein